MTSATKPRSLTEFLQSIDRRIAYLILAVATIITLLVAPKLPIFVTAEAHNAFDAIENAPTDKLVLIWTDYGASTMGENGPQIKAVMTHLMRRGIKFAIIGQDLQGPKLAQETAKDLGKELNKHYGVDWVNWGFKVGRGAMVQSLCRDIPGTIGRDINNTPVDQLPIMKNVKDIKDISLLINFVAGDTYGDYISFIQGPYGTPLIIGCTAIIGPDLFPYLDSGQVAGMLLGMKGAAEYEKLNGTWEKGSEAMQPQSIAHLLLIALILLANIGYVGGLMTKGKVS